MQKKSPREDWHRAEIVCAVWKRGMSLSRLGFDHGYSSPVTLSGALNHPYPKAERIIATFLGLRPHDIWPSRYHADGTPRSGRGERGRGRYKRKHNTAASVVNVDSRRAA